LVEIESGIFVTKSRGHMFAQFIGGAIFGQAQRETFRIDSLLPFGDRCELSVGESKNSAHDGSPVAEGKYSRNFLKLRQ
jgi:hypothetical protein